MSSVIGRRRRELTPGELGTYDRILGMAEEAITARVLVSFRALSEAEGLKYSTWLSLRDRVIRVDRPRLRRLNEIQSKTLDLGLSARGRVRAPVVVGGAVSAPNCGAQVSSPNFDAGVAAAPNPPSSPELAPAGARAELGVDADVEARRSLIDRAHARLVEPGTLCGETPRAEAAVVPLRPRSADRDALERVLSAVEDLAPDTRRRVLRTAAEFYAAG